MKTTDIKNSSKKEPLWLLTLDLLGWIILALTIFYLGKKIIYDHVIIDRKTFIGPIMMIFAFFLMTLVKYNPAMANGVESDNQGNVSESDASFVSMLMTILKTFTVLIIFGILYSELNQ